MADMRHETDIRCDLVDRTLWLIESHAAADLTLAGLARALGVGPFHLSRAFSIRTGRALMAYVRARRLSMAARRLARGGATVTEIAMEAGYDSHEGFTRAFRSRFDVSPSGYRASPQTYEALIQEALKLTTPDPAIRLEPRFEKMPKTRIVGTKRHYRNDERGEIPGQFREFFTEWFDQAVGQPNYGVCFAEDEAGFGFMVGIPAGPGTEGLEPLDLPAGTYAVFDVRGDVSAIPPTWDAIIGSWIPTSGCEPTGGPDFELYEPDYDPATPGGVSIWLPVSRPV